MKSTLLLLSLLLFFSITFADAQTKRKKTTRKKSKVTRNYETAAPQNFSQTVVVNPGSVSWIPVYLSKAGTLSGSFTAQGGRNDIQCFIVDDNGLTNLRNNNQFRSFYSSGIMTVDNFNLYLSPGNYYIVFNNKFALFTNKVVSVNYSFE